MDYEDALTPLVGVVISDRMSAIWQVNLHLQGSDGLMVDIAVELELFEPVVGRPPGRPDAGERLPHHFTLACAPRRAIGGMVSVPLSAGHPAWPFASTVPYGARTFLTGQTGRRDHPTHSPIVLYPMGNWE